jgi:putative polyhydroxyalkanoate system protein
MGSLRIDHAHSLSTEEARERIRALGDYLSNKHGLSVSWQGDDRASIRGKYLVVSIDGAVVLEPGNVRFEGKDPGMLWRGKAKDYLEAKLKKYLNPSTPAGDLPRG